MKNYFVIASPNMDNFEEHVNKAISEGYEPLGGVEFSAQAMTFFQAMYKKPVTQKIITE